MKVLVTMWTLLPSAFGLLSFLLPFIPQPSVPVVFAMSNLAFHEYYYIILGIPTLQSGSYINTNVDHIWECINNNVELI